MSKKFSKSKTSFNLDILKYFGYFLGCFEIHLGQKLFSTVVLCAHGCPRDVITLGTSM